MQTGRRELTPGHFRPAQAAAKLGERIAGLPIGFWKDSWIRLKKNRGALVSLAAIAALFAMAFVIAPLLSTHSPYAQDLARRISPAPPRSSGSARTSSGGTCGRGSGPGPGSPSI